MDSGLADLHNSSKTPSILHHFLRSMGASTGYLEKKAITNEETDKRIKGVKFRLFVVLIRGWQETRESRAANGFLERIPRMEEKIRSICSGNLAPPGSSVASFETRPFGDEEETGI